MGRVVGFKLDFPKIWVREINTEIEFSRQAIIRAVEGDLILDGGVDYTHEEDEADVETATPAVEINPGYLAIYTIGDNGNNGNVFIRSLKNENERFYCEISQWEIAGRTVIGTLHEVRAWLSAQLPCQPIKLIFGLAKWEDNSDSLGIATEVPAPQAPQAPPDVLTMPHNPFLNELGFYTQIRRFIGLELGTDCKIEFMKHSGRHEFIYRVTTSDGVVYRLEKVGILNDSYHRFTKANDTDFEYDEPSDNSYLEWISNHPGTPAQWT